MKHALIGILLFTGACHNNSEAERSEDTLFSGGSDYDLDTSESVVEDGEPVVGDTYVFEILGVYDISNGDNTDESGIAVVAPPLGKCGGAAPGESSFVYGGRLTNTGTGTTKASCYYKDRTASDGDQCFLKFTIRYSPYGYSATNKSARAADSYYRGDGGIMFYTYGSESFLRMDYKWCNPLEAEDGFKL